MSMQNTRRLENLSGSYRDIGRQHGRENAAHIRYLLHVFGVKNITAWEPRHFIDPLKRHLPDLADEIHGIAEGSGCSLKEICGLSFLVDLGTAAGACTGVAFASGPDGPVVAKTSDCTPGVQQVWLAPRRIRPAGQLAAITLSHVGSPNVEMGMNENGLAIGITGLQSVRVDRNGVGWQQDIRAVLHHCTTSQDAIHMLRTIPIRSFGYSLVIGDSSGDVAVVEKVVGAFGVKRPNSNVAFVTNVPQCPEVIPHTPTAAVNANGQGRMALLRQLCADESRLDFSLEGMLRLFSTHGEPVGICQHGPELHSNTGFFMLPRNKEVWMTRGYTCYRNLEVLRF